MTMFSLLMQFIFLIISLIISCSFLFIIIVNGIKNKINQFFCLYLTFEIVWLISGIFLRFTLSHQDFLNKNILLYNPEFWLTLTGFSLALITFSLYKFSFLYVNKQNRFYNIIFYSLLISTTFLFIAHLYNPLFFDSQISAIGFVTTDFHWTGFLGLLLINLPWLLSMYLLCKVHYVKGVKLLILSIAIYGGGLLFGLTRIIHIPIIPVTTFISNLILGYTIVKKQVINPIREKSIRLEQELIKIIELEENIQSYKKDRSHLLKEIHHRVRNNLQVISSLAHYHSKHIQKNNSWAIMDRFQELIQSMAFVHSCMYINKNFADINFSEYINKLNIRIKQSYPLPGNLVVKQNIMNPVLSVNQAISCGIVFYELISNVYKHAFPENYQGNPTLELTLHDLDNDEFEIIVHDNGVGMPVHFDFNNIDTIGLELVKILVEEQLQGHIDLIKGNGTMFIIRIKRIKDIS